MVMSRFRCSVFVLQLCIVICCAGGSLRAQVDTFKDSFVQGREYFVLRSGNAKLILQADKSGMQPAFTYMLFDASKPCQTMRKERAFNYCRDNSCSASALEVVLGGVPFVALGHTTDVRWQYRDGIPTVEARWWAGGVEVKESFLALEGSNAFLRKIDLYGKDLAGPDSVRLRLRLPPGTYYTKEDILVGLTQGVALGVEFAGVVLARADKQEGYIESLPIFVKPGSQVAVTTVLMTRIPAQGFVYDPKCGDEQPIPRECLRAGVDTSGLRGLTSEYFNNSSLTGNCQVVRTDTTLLPYWDTSAPAEGIRPDSFSVRWTGMIMAPRPGRYKFSLVADDKGRLYIDDTLLIDCWENSWNVAKTAEIPLESGSFHRIRVEYAELSGWAGMRLKWSLPSLAPDPKGVEAGIREILASLDGMRRSFAADEIARTAKQWRQKSMLSSGDSLVQQLFDRARFSLPGMVGPNGAMDAGIFEYGDQWVRDGSNVLLGLVHGGQFELARALLRYILDDLVSAEGTTVVSGAYDQPDREEFDQMGELVHALKTYYDWTGDSALIINSRRKILALIERPLQESFRDSTGMVHNRREYWERTFDDAYELAYQTFMIRGLRDAADLAGVLGVPEKAALWRREGDVLLKAMLYHPTRSLVDQGALIKRRNVDGSVAHFVGGSKQAFSKDDPYSSEAFHCLNPDAAYALPIGLRVIEPRSELARKTLDKLETIWNARWNLGGYERYHSSSQVDQPGPWSFATASIARAQHDAGMLERSRRSLDWLSRIPGGNAGAWFEEIPLLRSQMPTSGIVPWTSAEIVLFTVRHWLGLSFEGKDLILRPNLFAQDRDVKADLRFRSSRIRLELGQAGEVNYALVNNKKIAAQKDGSVRIPSEMLNGNLDIKLSSRPGSNSLRSNWKTDAKGKE